MKTAHLRLPASWEELTAPELRYVARLMHLGLPAADIQTLLALRLLTPALARRAGERQTAWATTLLDWMAEPPRSPVRPPLLAGGEAVDPLLQGEPFATLLTLDNLWTAALAPLALNPQPPQRPQGPPRWPAALYSLLWPGWREEGRRPWHDVLPLLWVTPLKATLAATFPNLYRPAAPGAPPPDMRESMETQIRALTGGDVTKRRAVLETDTWAALHELDCLAREAQERAGR